MFSDKKNPDQRFLYLLGAITLVGFFLRLNGLGSESLTADEASALLRIKFPSFSSMIEGGVRPDGHPAFTQVLLWFWTKCFGWSEFSVRLPFAVFGTASIWLSGVIAKKWFSNTTGLATASGIAFLQFTLMYSQLARPYAPGLFFTLLSTYYWTRFVKVREDSFGDNSKSKFDIAGFAFAAALAAYSHYFSLLTTTLLAIAGIFFVAREIRKQYLLSCVIAVLLFLPHISITLSQMEIGGVGGPGGWLGKPTPEFFLNHLKFIFNGSRGMMWGVFLVSCFSFVVWFKKPDKFQLLAILLWFLPLVIGYYYSIARNPLLQDSVLLFGFPFLLMFLFSRLPHYNLKKLGIVFPIGFSLVFLCYVTIYKPFHLTDHFGSLKELVSNTIDWQKKFAKEKVDVAYNVDADYFVDYYYDKFGVKRKNVLTTIVNGKTDLLSFKKMVQNSKADFFVYCWSTKYSSLDIIPIIEEEFPFLIEKREWFNSAIYLFTKNSFQETNIRGLDKGVVFESNNNFSPEYIPYDKQSDTYLENAIWTKPTHLILDSTFYKQACKIQGMWSPGISKYVELDSACIYSPLLKMKVGDILNNPDNTILFSTKVKLLNKNSDVVMVIEFQRDGKQLYWNGIESTTQVDNTRMDEWQSVYFGLQLPADIKSTDTVSFYCYTKDGLPVLIDYLEVKTLKGHSGIYGPRPDFK